MRTTEYLAHRLIGTPLEAPARRVAALRFVPKRLRHPELGEIFAEPGRLERAVRDIVTPGMHCIDVGAHLGSTLNLLVRLAPAGHHLAIEPIPHQSRWLTERFPTVDVHQVAVGAESAVTTFYYQPDHSGFSGLRPHTMGQADRRVEELQVECVTLDELVPADRTIGFVKIDVEGGELAVLQGAGELLDRDGPTVLFECTASSLAAHDVDRTDVYDLLSGHGYRLYRPRDWLDRSGPLSADAFGRALDYPFEAFNFVAARRPPGSADA